MADDADLTPAARKGMERGITEIMDELGLDLASAEDFAAIGRVFDAVSEHIGQR